MSRANSLKKAVRQIIEHAEKTLDEQTSSHNHKIVVVRPMSLTVQQQVFSEMGKDNILSPENESFSTRSDNNKLAQEEQGEGHLRATVYGRLVGDEACSSFGTIPVASSDPTALQPFLINQCASSSGVSQVDPNVTLPVPRVSGDQARKLSNASTNASTISADDDLEDEVADLEKNDIPLIDGSDNSDDLEKMAGKVEKTIAVDVEAVNFEVQQEEDDDLKAAFPKIEVESPSSSARTQKDSDDSVIEADNDTSIGQDSSCASNNIDLSGAAAATAAIPGDGSGGLLVVPGSKAFPRGASPRGSRRISMGSLLKPLEVEIPTSPKSSKGDHSDLSYSSAANSPFSSSAHSSPNKSSSNQHTKRKKTLPIVNPLVSHPAWPAVASGGVVSKVLLANADTICAVASPLMDPEIDPDDLMLGFEEKCVMNNYFGIGIDAKITLDFHLKREEHPEKLRSRTRNFLWYGVLGGKEFLQKSCKNLEQRVQLECDGKRLPLPSLQGIVILNIQR